MTNMTTTMESNGLLDLVWSTTGLAEAGSLNLSENNGLLARAEYPEAWAKIALALEENTRAVADDAAWLAEVAANGLCGKYSTGDGETTFRVPLLRKVYIRAADAARGLEPGMYLADSFAAHHHRAKWSSPVATASSTGSLRSVPDVNAEYTNTVPAGHGKAPVPDFMETVGGDETRPKTVIYTPLLRMRPIASGGSSTIPDLRPGVETPWPMRREGKQVYAKLIEFGTLPAPFGLRGVLHEVTGIGWKQIAWDHSSITRSTDGQELTLSAASTPSISNGALPWRFAVDKNSVQCNMLTNTDYREWDTVVLCLLYTKTA